jgi:hypothetical protein
VSGDEAFRQKLGLLNGFGALLGGTSRSGATDGLGYGAFEAGRLLVEWVKSERDLPLEATRNQSCSKF